MTWTYNQGVLLSGLSGLYKFTGDTELLKSAQQLIDAVLSSYLVPSSSGVLVESCDPFRTCDQDQWMFKGIFFQHLGYLLEDISQLGDLSLSTRKSIIAKYSAFIQANACAVWEVARQKDGKIGNWWDGPPGEEIRRQVSVETHGSGVGAVLCAVETGNLLGQLEGLMMDSKRDLDRGIRGLGLCEDKCARYY
jgi:predicted alpha-1,6-mannanase (GH76 family)